MPKKGEIRKWDAENTKKDHPGCKSRIDWNLLVSKTYGVPIATLQKAARSYEANDDILAVPLGRKPVYNRNVETELIRYLKEMETNFPFFSMSKAKQY